MEFLKNFYNFDSPKNGIIVGHCQLCKFPYNDKVGSTGNFHKHLKRKHKKEYSKGKKQSYDDSESDGESVDQIAKYEEKLNESFTKNLIVKCNLPPAIIEQSGFREFMKLVAPKWKPSSSRYIKTKIIPSLRSFVQRKIDKMLNEIDSVTITTDIWTDRRGKAFIGITGHFVNVDFMPQAVLLDFVRLKGRHTAENIRTTTENILEKLNLTGKIYRIITDNASNMIKAYKFGLTVAAIDEQQDQPQRDGDDESSSDTNTSDYDDPDFETEWTLVDPIDDENQELEEENTNIRLSCFAHSLQLVVRDGLTDVPHLSKTLIKCKNLSKKSHKSTKIADLLDDVDKKLKRSNATRWSSEYLLIRSILDLGKETIEEITNLLNDDDLKFNNNDFNVLEEVVEILEPFADITTSCQSEIVATVSMVVPSIVHVIHYLKQMKTKTSLLKKMITQLDRSINIRFSGIVKRLSMEPINKNDPFNDPLYFVATILDPKFRFRWLSLLDYSQSFESKVKQSLMNLIFDECECNTDKQLDQSSSSQPSSSGYTTQTNASTITKKRKLFQYDEDDLFWNNSELSPSDELTAYIDDPSRITSLAEWKNSPLSSMKSVVKRVFTVQASSAPIERTFSQSGLIMSPRRTSMRDELFQSMVYLRVNKYLL